MADTWDETKPSGSRQPLLGDDDIREFKRAIRERLAQDHEFASSESPAFGDTGSVIGFHKKVVFTEQGSNPTVPANAGGLFCKLVGSQSELHWKDEGGNVIRMTAAGKMDVDKAIVAKDHNQGTTAEVGNVIMGTGSAPAASSVPYGTIFLKYIA